MTAPSRFSKYACEGEAAKMLCGLFLSLLVIVTDFEMV